MEKLLEPEGVATSAPTATPRAKAVRVRRTKGKVATTGTASVKPLGGVRSGAPMLILSAALNGYANAQALAGRGPLADGRGGAGDRVLVLAKVCGEKYRAGQKPIARFAAASGVASSSPCLALLTVHRTADRFARGRWALPMAVAIDCGLVACEVALIGETRE